ncbi:hypothetical protein SteCoe_6684 [Stentor coeruleus]|uniref:Citrate synthase n=1 Tax=Stentor coeruleus TaxID=5963 RepID=A0A1R2CPI8_9CILI|nr:hypothetical protein SteCoe_6684 [Stentor coeruleus]
MHFKIVRTIAELHGILENKIATRLEQVHRLKYKYGSVKIEEIKVEQIVKGMKGMATQLTESLSLDPDFGVRFRGLSIEECQEKLPKKRTQPYIESMIWLLLTGDIPTPTQTDLLKKELALRCFLPKYTEDMLKKMIEHFHPMNQLSMGVLSLGYHSNFDKLYNSHMKKSEYWKPMLDDSLDLIAKIPRIASIIYRNSYRNGVTHDSNPSADYAENFGKMLGWDDEDFYEFLRLYINSHCDHEAGNVIAHTSHVVGSALCNVFKSYSAGLNGLAGPIHRLSSQECLRWLINLWKKVGDYPTDEAIVEYAKNCLDSGKNIPGYGHEILRIPDPRFIAQLKFANEMLPDDPLCNLVGQCFKIIPDVLKEFGKVKYPYPNAEAHSEVLMYSYGLRIYDYYTVLFGVARAIGCCINLVWDRALMFPLERPDGITIDSMMKICSEK